MWNKFAREIDVDVRPEITDLQKLNGKLRTTMSNLSFIENNASENDYIRHSLSIAVGQPQETTACSLRLYFGRECARYL